MLRNIASSLFISLMTAVLLLGSVEIYFRNRDIIPRDGDGADFTDPNYYSLAPYVMFKNKPSIHFAGMEINDLGYPGPLATVPKSKKEFRIIVIGGSTLLDHLNSVPYLMEQALHRRGYSHAKVYNMGVASSVSGQALARIVFEAIDLEPNLVIIYNGANDLEGPYLSDPRPGYPFNFFVMEANPVYHVSERDYPWLAVTLYGSAFLRNWIPGYFFEKFTNYTDIELKSPMDSEEWKEQVVDRYWQHMTKSSRVLKQYDSEFIGVLQPLVYYKQHPTEEERANQNTQFLSTPSILESQLRLRELVRRKAAKDSSFMFFDKTELFDETHERVYRDTCHIFDQHRLTVAESLAELVIKNSKLSSSH